MSMSEREKLLSSKIETQLSNNAGNYCFYVVTSSDDPLKIKTVLENMQGVKVLYISGREFYIRTPKSYDSASAIIHGLKRNGVFTAFAR